MTTEDLHKLFEKASRTADAYVQKNRDREAMKLRKKLIKKLDGQKTNVGLPVLSELICRIAVQNDMTERDFVRGMRQSFRIVSDGSEF